MTKDDRQKRRVISRVREQAAGTAEVGYLLRSPANAQRLTKALNDRFGDTEFRSVDELRAKLGLPAHRKLRHP
jgi:hypothetical protein